MSYPGTPDPYRSASESDDVQMIALMNKTKILQKVYYAVFVLSLVLLFVPGMRVVWALTLASAVAIRLYRQSLVNKYNQLLAGGGPSRLV